MFIVDEGTPVVSIRKYPTISVDEAAQTDLRIEQELMSRIPDPPHHGAPVPTNWESSGRVELNRHVRDAGAAENPAW